MGEETVGRIAFGPPPQRDWIADLAAYGFRVCSGPAPPARPHSDASRQSDSDSSDSDSPWPDPSAAIPDADSEHANRDLRAVADRHEALGRGKPDVGTVADVRGVGRQGVPSASGLDVAVPDRDQAGRGQAVNPIRYSSTPDLIEQIRAIDAQRQDWQRRALDAEARLRVRDARVEPPDEYSHVLVWIGPESKWLRSFRRRILEWSEWDGLGMTTMERPYWLPMPPPPGVKQ